MVMVLVGIIVLGSLGISLWLIRSAKVLGDLYSHTQIFAGGNLANTVMPKYPNIISPIAGGIQAIVERLKHFICEVQVNVGQVRAAVVQLAQSVEIVEQAVLITEESGNKMVRVAEQSNKSSEVVAGQMNTAVDLALEIETLCGEMTLLNKQVLVKVEQGITSLSDTKKIMAQVEASSKSLNLDIEKLQSYTGQINSIIKEIGDFASKTKMLSLNAGIEAAKASENGLGFSVIAEEVKSLSEQSSGAVSKIIGLLENVKLIGAKLEELIANELEQVDVAVENVTKAEGVFRFIGYDMETVQQSLEKVAQRGTLQLKAIQNIQAEAEELATISGDAKYQASEVFGSVHQQLAKIQELRALSILLEDKTGELDNSSKQITIAEFNESARKQIATLEAELVPVGKELVDMPESRYQAELKKICEQYQNLQAYWVNRPDGTFVFSYPPAGIVNAGKRSWFQHAQQGKNFVSDIYVSAISKRPCVTLALPVIKDQQLIAVIGVDLGV